MADFIARSIHTLSEQTLSSNFLGAAQDEVTRSKKSLRNLSEAAQHFAPVPEAVWAYRIGGYQVCEKWLKDRRDRRLDLDDIRTCCRIVTALKRTIDIQGEIDALYSEVEAHILSLSNLSKT